MSTHLLRYDGNQTNTMTVTAAQTTRAATFVSGHEPAAPGKRDDQRVDMASDKKRKTDKKSPEYLIKSGLAGGFAGCAVCTHSTG